MHSSASTRRALAVTAGLLTLVITAGCGGGSLEQEAGATAAPGTERPRRGPAEPAGFVACDLLTTDEVATVVAGPAGPGAPSGLFSTETGNSDCDWARTDDESTSLSLAYYDSKDYWDVERYTGTDTPEAVADLGDESFVTRSTFQDSVGFIRGEHVVMLTSQFANGMSNELIAVARLVDGRLQ